MLTQHYQYAQRQEDELQSFLASFIEQTTPPQLEGLKRTVRQSGITEKLLGLVPVEVRGSSDSACLFSPDEANWARDYVFLQVTFLGIEPDLLLHDILTYSSADIIFQRPYASAICTYAMHVFRMTLKRYFGLANLSKKSSLDSHFLASP
mmetsp:Transcript_7954/g.11709  ORF Transcript_7954/g.11709 Transcript_7954/m.11709 type:complete len:150 (-) Transcript_7954:149-598(-)